MSIAKVNVFGAQPYGFKATDVSGCKVWLDAADLSTVFQQIPYGTTPGIITLTDAQRFYFWKDKSTGNHDMVKKFAANSAYNPGEPISTSNAPYNVLDTSPEFLGPTISPPNQSIGEVNTKITFEQYSNVYGSNQLKTYPDYLFQNLVELGGYNGDLTGNPGPSGPRVGADPVYSTEVFVVVRPTYLNVAGNVFSIGSKPGKAADFTSLALTSAGYWKINSTGGARDVTSSSAEQLNLYSNDPNYRILNMSLSNTSYILRRNSVQIGSANKSWSPTLSNYQYVIAKKTVSDTSDPFDGRIGEILVFDNILNSEKRTIVESYLANKWNLIALLPANHPARLQNTPIYLGGRSMAEDPNGFIRRATMIKIFVQAPSAPDVNPPVISNSGTILTSSWSAGIDGSPNYYNVTVLNSTNGTTWTSVKYLPRYLPTSYVYTIGSIDDKYYQTQVEARNSGGSVLTTSASILNSIPGNPTVDTPYKISTNTLYLSWSAGGGGTPLTYTVYLESSTDNVTWTQIYTISGVTGTNITTTGNNSTPVLAYSSANKYRSRVQAVNGTGSSSIINSSSYQYPSELN